MSSSQTTFQLIILLAWLFLIGLTLTRRKPSSDPRLQARQRVTRQVLLLLGVFSALAAAARLERWPAELVNGLLLAAMVASIVGLVLLLRARNDR